MLSNEQSILAAPATHSCSLHLRTTPIHFYVLSWILVIPLLYFATNSSPSLLNHDNNAFMTNSSNLMRMQSGVRPDAVLFYAFMTGLMFAGRTEIIRAVTKHSFIVLSGPILAAASTLWSGSPLLTLRYSLDLALATAFACYLSERFSSEHLMRLLIFVGTAAAALSIGLALFLPSYGMFQRYDGGAWQGIFSHKNALGLTMASLLTPIFFLRQRLTVKVGYSAVLLILIALSQSRTAWFVATGLIVFVAWLFLFRRLRGVESLMLSIAAIFCMGIVAMFATSHLAVFMKMIGKDPTLTGRTLIYQLVVEAILKRPIAGYGYGAFWLATTAESRNIAMIIGWPNIGYAENGFLELGLQLGLGGVALAMVIFGRSLNHAVRLLRSPYYTPRVGWFVALIFMELITNIDAGLVLQPGNLTWVLTLIGVLGLANEISRISTPDA
jgi:exopolysaccharide production protein ExoQ